MRSRGCWDAPGDVEEGVAQRGEDGDVVRPSCGGDVGTDAAEGLEPAHAPPAPSDQNGLSSRRRSAGAGYSRAVPGLRPAGGGGRTVADRGGRDGAVSGQRSVRRDVAALLRPKPL